MQFLGKNVVTGVYIDLQLWAQCLLSRAWISMTTVTRRMQTQRFLFIVVQERPASYFNHWLCTDHSTGLTYQRFAWETQSQGRGMMGLIRKTRR